MFSGNKRLMKTEKYLLIGLLITVFTLVFCSESYCNPKDAKNALINYLNKRSQGEYQNCINHYSNKYKKRHIKELGTSCYDYFRTNEMRYYDSKIINTKERKRKFILKIATSIEDPTSTAIYLSAIENYAMVMESGEWKIDSWSIKYKNKKIKIRN